MSAKARSMSRYILLAALVVSAVVASRSAIGQKADAKASKAAAAAQAAKELRPPEAFAKIGNAKQRSLALFNEAGKVLLHPRCVNCHPDGDSPLQGENKRLHEPPVLRGVDGFGVAGMRCQTCHQEKNFDPGQIPGTKNWHLAPREMAWVGKSLGQICEQIKDPERNGGRNLEEIVKHMVEDELVAWGWAPGAGREPAPGDHATFGKLITAWAQSGAACPPK